MADATDVKAGDKVSWSWGAGQPAGTAAEVKTDTVTMETARGNEVKKDGEPGDPAVRVERSGHDVVKKASELEVEKPGPKHSGGENKDGADKTDGVTQNNEGKDVSAAGKPDDDTKAEHAAQKEEKKEEKQAPINETSAPTNGTDTKHEKNKGASHAPVSTSNSDKKQSAAPAQKAAPSGDSKAKPEKKAKAPPKPKVEKAKRKAATESGEPRRSKRIRGE